MSTRFRDGHPALLEALSLSVVSPDVQKLPGGADHGMSRVDTYFCLEKTVSRQKGSKAPRPHDPRGFCPNDDDDDKHDKLLNLSHTSVTMQR